MLRPAVLLPPQLPGLFTGAPSLGSRHQMPASYEVAWSYLGRTFTNKLCLT